MAARQSKFWAEHAPILEALVKQGLSDIEIVASGKIPGKKLAAIRGQRAQMGLPGGHLFRSHRLTAFASRIVSETPERTVYGSDAVPEDVEETWSAAVKRTRKHVQRMKTEACARLQIMTDKPVALTISSDWHVTGIGACDLEGLGEYAEAVRDTQGAWAVAVGDLMDNPIKWSKSMAQVPEDYLLLARLLGTFGYKLLGTTSGNHDDWSVAFAGIDALKWLAERERIHYAPDELVYIVELVDPRTGQSYPVPPFVIATRHRYYRHSNLNPLHACWRWLEDRIGGWPTTDDGGELVPDILAVGHNHVAEVGVRNRGERTVWGARMGAWHRSGHSRAGGWPHSPPTAPTFILYPGRSRPIRGFEDYREALDALRTERGEWEG